MPLFLVQEVCILNGNAMLWIEISKLYQIPVALNCCYANRAAGCCYVLMTPLTGG